MGDLFDETKAPQPVTTSKKCVACAAPVTRSLQIFCAACRSQPMTAAERIADDVAALDDGWRALLATASDTTQERWVSVLVAHGEAYEPGQQHVQRKRVAGFRARLRKTIDAGGEIGAIAAAYDRYLSRRADLVLVNVIAAFGEATQKGGK